MRSTTPARPCAWSCEDHRSGRRWSGTADGLVNAKIAAHRAWRALGRTSLKGVALTVVQPLAQGPVIHKGRESAIGLVSWEKLDG